MAIVRNVKIHRVVTFDFTVPIAAYPGMTDEEIVSYEQDAARLTEDDLFIDEAQISDIETTVTFEEHTAEANDL